MAGLYPIRVTLRPIVETLVPGTVGIDVPAYDALVRRIDERLAHEPAALSRQLRLFVRVLTWLPLLTRLRTFPALDAAARLRFLEGIQDGPVQKLRLGLWGLRTLVYLGWYGDPEVAARLGWRPQLGGWPGRPAGPAPQRHASPHAPVRRVAAEEALP